MKKIIHVLSQNITKSVLSKIQAKKYSPSLERKTCGSSPKHRLLMVNECLN